jgi:hypothetical protein
LDGGRDGCAGLKRQYQERKADTPSVDIHIIRGVFTPDQKQSMIEKVTDAGRGAP